MSLGFISSESKTNPLLHGQKPWTCLHISQPISQNIDYFIYHFLFKQEIRCTMKAIYFNFFHLKISFRIPHPLSHINECRVLTSGSEKSYAVKYTHFTLERMCVF